MMPDVDWSLILSHLGLMSMAYILAIPVGFDREKEKRGAGLRTFPLVAVGSCGYTLIGLEVLPDAEGYARILYGLMTGIGFIGGGAIIKDKGSVTGTATAASIWITGAIGAAVAWRRYEIAIVLSLLNFATFRWFSPIKDYVKEDENKSSRSGS